MAGGGVVYRASGLLRWGSSSIFNVDLNTTALERSILRVALVISQSLRLSGSLTANILLAGAVGEAVSLQFCLHNAVSLDQESIASTFLRRPQHYRAGEAI